MFKKMKPANIICFGGILTAITVILQLSPVFLPVIGMALSPFSSMPVLLAAFLNIPMGLVVLVSAVFLTFVVSPQEAVILMLTTGLLGFAVGALLNRKGVMCTAVISAITLFTGILILTYVVGIPAFGDFSKSFSLIIIFFSLVFSFVYTCIWIFFAKRFIGRLKKVKLLQSFFD